MSLIIVIGSNLNDRKKNLNTAKEFLSKEFRFISESRIYTSPAVEYLDQNDFLNQALEFIIPDYLTPDETMLRLLAIEKKLGRTRDIAKGPRIIDIDIIFWGTEKHQTANVTIPHPACFDRSFVMKPVQELPYFETLKKYFTIPSVFSNKADPI